MTLKAQDIIYVALRLIGVLRPGQTANPETLTDGLSALNSMMDQWGTMGLTLPVEGRNVFTVTASQQTYTLGTGGNWNIPRPDEVTGINWIVQGTYPTEVPMQILSDEEWRMVASKSTPSPQSTWAHLEMEPTVISVDLWPLPSAGGQVAVYHKGPLMQFADLNTTSYNFQPGYDLALKYNLAEQMWPLFIGPQLKNGGVTLPQIQQQAAGYLRKLKVRNISPVSMNADPFNEAGRYWIYSDSTIRGTR